jgi:DNA-binding CsgD family transcriptional regulator
MRDWRAARPDGLLGSREVRPQPDSVRGAPPGAQPLDPPPEDHRAERTWLELLGDLQHDDSSEAPPAGDELVFETIRDGVRYRLSREPTRDAERIELSAREQEVARMVAKGYTNKTIAAVLEISTWTVDTYLRRIFSKLDVRSRSAMVTRLTRDRVIDPETTPDWTKALSRRRR